MPIALDFRLANLLLFLLACLLNSVLATSFVTHTTQLAALYGVSPATVSLNSSLYSIVYPIFFFLASYFLHRRGLRNTVALGSVLNVAGAALRLLMHHSFAFAVLGSIVGGIGHVFIGMTPLKLAGNWFKTEESTLVVALSYQLLLGSNALGGFLPSLLLGPHLTIQEVRKYALVEFLILAVGYGLVLFFFRDKPAQPPSSAALRPQADFKQSIADLFCNPNYLLLAFSLFFCLGVVGSFITVVSLLLSPFGIESARIGRLVIMSYLCGLASSALIGFLVGRHKKYKAVLLATSVSTAVLLLLLAPALELETSWLPQLIFCLLGACTFPFLSLSCEFAAEVAFPVDESTSSSLCLLVGSVNSFFLGSGISSFLDSSTTNAKCALAIMAAALLLGAGLIQATEQRLMRSEYELKHSCRIDQC